jgi:CRP/FNR family transcriptional regulator
VGEGRVKIFRTGAQGREQVLHVEGPGATLEEVPLFDRAGYVASAAAQTDALLLWLSRREIEVLCRRHPEVALAIIATMACRIRTFAGPAADLALRSVPARLGRLLLDEGPRAARKTVGRGGGHAAGNAGRRRRAHQNGTRAALARTRRAGAPGVVTVRGRRVVVRDLGRLEEAAGSAD